MSVKRRKKPKPLEETVLAALKPPVRIQFPWYPYKQGTLIRLGPGAAVVDMDEEIRPYTVSLQTRIQVLDEPIPEKQTRTRRSKLEMARDDVKRRRESKAV